MAANSKIMRNGVAYGAGASGPMIGESGVAYGAGSPPPTMVNGQAYASYAAPTMVNGQAYASYAAPIMRNGVPPGSPGDDGVRPPAPGEGPRMRPANSSGNQQTNPVTGRPRADGEPYWDGRSRGPESVRWLAWNKANNPTAGKPKPVMPVKPSPIRPTPPSGGYGAFMNLPAGSKVDRRFVDKDGDGTDDRYQSGPGQSRGGAQVAGVRYDDPKLGEVRRAEQTVPANVQNAYNLYQNPPAGTGGFKPTREMVRQFEQYGLNNQPNQQTSPSAPSSTTGAASNSPDSPALPDTRPDYESFRRRRKGLGSLRTI